MMERFIKKCLETDQSISAWFALQSNRWLHTLLTSVSYSGSFAVISIIGICFLVIGWLTGQFTGRNTGFDPAVRLTLLILVLELIDMAVIIGLRSVTRRKRPVDLDRRIWFDVWNIYSFPSHHASRAFMIATVLGMAHTAGMPFLYFMASLIGFSRIYLLKHYLSDVIIGAVLGVFIGSIAVSMQSLF